MNASDIALARLRIEEGFRAYAYDDATGLRVRAPVGNLTWLYGCNLETSGSQPLADLVLRFQLEAVAAELTFPWYLALDPPRQSVCLDIAFNGGVADLLHYPHMIAALAKGDWETAANECTEKDPKLDASRYAPLREILRTGVA